MKNIIFTILIFVFGISFGQTSMDDYIYSSQGLPDQLLKRQDLNSGYLLKNLSVYPKYNINFINEKNETATRSISAFSLHKEGFNNPVSIIFAFERSDNDFVKYLCVPVLGSSKEVYDQAYLDFNAYTKDWNIESASYTWCLLKLIAEIGGK